MSNHPIIKALQAELAKERDKAFRYPELSAQISCSSHYFAFVSGHEAATERLMAVIEKAVEFVDFIEFHESKYVDNGPEETTVYLQKAREFLTTLTKESDDV